MKISPGLSAPSFFHRIRELAGSAFGFDRLAYFSIDHPRRTILSFAVLVLLAAPGLLRLQLRTDGHALVPPGDPAVAFDARVRQHFGLRDPIVVVLQTPRPNGIFNPDTLRRVRDLTAVLEKLDGVPPGGVTSLATEKRDRVYPGTLDFRRFLDAVPETAEDMATFRGDLEAIGILHGNLVSKDQSAVAILVGAPNVLDRSGAPGGVNAAAADRVALCRRIVEAAGRFESPGNRVRVVGAPMAESLLGLHILQDLVLLLPLSIAIIGFVLWLGCRRIAGVLQGMIQLVAAQIFTFGLMGWLGVPVYLTTAVLPVILTTLALADEIHLFWRYQQLLGPVPGKADREHPEAVRVLLSQMSRPIVLATLTTIVGFLSFLSSPLVAVRSFGAFAGVGLLFCLFWSLMVGPAMLALLPPSSLRRPVGKSAAPSERFRRFFTPLFRTPRRTLGTIAIATLLVGLGIGRLEVQDSWLSGFAPGSQFRQDTEEVNRLFNGTHLLEVQLDLADWHGTLGDVWEGVPGPLLDPRTLRAIGDFEAFLGRQPRVGGVLGPASQLETISFLRHARDPKRLSIPGTAAEVADLVHWFDEVRTAPRRREVIDDARRQGVITLFLKDPDYKQVDALMKSGPALRPRAARAAGRPHRFRRRHRGEPGDDPGDRPHPGLLAAAGPDRRLAGGDPPLPLVPGGIPDRPAVVRGGALDAGPDGLDRDPAGDRHRDVLLDHARRRNRLRHPLLRGLPAPEARGAGPRRGGRDGRRSRTGDPGGHRGDRARVRRPGHLAGALECPPGLPGGGALAVACALTLVGLGTLLDRSVARGSVFPRPGERLVIIIRSS